MKKLNELIRDLYRNAETINFEGFPAWSLTDEEKLEQLCFTGTVGNTFYVNQREMLGNALKFLEDIAKKNPSLLAEKIVSGRNEGYIRTIPILGLIFLRLENAKLFKKVFNDIIRTGNDLVDFIDLNKSLKFGFGRSAKTAIINWLKEKLNEYYAIKYRKQIADAIRLSHPKTTDPIYDFVLAISKEIDEEKFNLALEKYPKLKAFEEAKKAIKDENYADARKLILENRLDVSSLLGIRTQLPTSVWSELAMQMPVMMYLKYLAKLDRAGVFDNEYEEKNLELLENKITVKNLQKAKVFPFRLYIAHSNITNKRVCYHLSNTLDDYVNAHNWGIFNKFTWAVCPDVSGSMTSRVKGSNLTPAIIAGLFSGFFYRGLKTVKIIPWDTVIHNFDIKKERTVIDTVREIANASGGGTAMQAPIKHLIKNKIKRDVFLLITDSIEWVGGGWLNTWKEYKQKINKNAIAILIRVDGYRTKPFSQEIAEEYSIYQIFGWNDNVMKFIQFILEKL